MRVCPEMALRGVHESAMILGSPGKFSRGRSKPCHAGYWSVEWRELRESPGYHWSRGRGVKRQVAGLDDAVGTGYD